MEATILAKSEYLFHSLNDVVGIAGSKLGKTSPFGHTGSFRIRPSILGK